jgi:tRNA dimethylallyltransferase
MTLRYYGLKTLFEDIPNPLLVIVGSTGVGKTEISVQLANRLDAEIISADSRLFYRGMDIGTAKPSQEQRKKVRHHMIDIANPDEIWSLAAYQSRVMEIITDIHRRRKLPILVGGSGQYIRAITEGWVIPGQSPDENLRKELTSWGREIGSQNLHRKLSLLDTKAALIIDSNNLRRVVRALEVIFNTGKLFSEQRQRTKIPFSLLMVGIKRPRRELYERIDQRINEMIEANFIEEVNKLLSNGYNEELPTLSAIGYGEIVEYLKGTITLDEAITLIKRKTRVFVRRQANWFKESDPFIHWLTADVYIIEKLEAIVKDINQWKILI